MTPLHRLLSQKHYNNARWPRVISFAQRIPNDVPAFVRSTR